MAIVPITFEDIHNYLVEEERIVCKSIKLDDSLKKLIRKNGIKIKDKELRNILDAVNKQIKRKYRIGLFLKQTRFQAIKQVIELEREKKTKQVEKLNDVNSVLDILSDDLNEASDNDEIFNLFGIIEELPDSNLINTNDVELIAMFDEVREKLLRNIKKYRKLSKDINELERIEEKLKSKTSLKEEEQSEDIDNKIIQEIERMRYLLALNH